MKFLNEIENIIYNTNFSIHSEDENYISISTRENGCVASENYSDIDLEDAKLLKKKLTDMLKDCSVSIECVDEWVHINITDKTYTNKNEIISYTLMTTKGGYYHSKGNTSEEHLKSIKHLINRFIFNMSSDSIMELLNKENFIDGRNTKFIKIQDKHNKCRSLKVNNPNFCLLLDQKRLKEVDGSLLFTDENKFFKKYKDYDDEYFSFEIYVNLINERVCDIVPNKDFYIKKFCS